MSARIRVEEVADLHVPCECGESECVPQPAYGTYDERDHTITLDGGLAHERARDTFMHECLHAMLSFANLDGLVVKGGDGLDEHLVKVLAPIMIDFLRSNPQAVGYLRESL